MQHSGHGDHMEPLPLLGWRGKRKLWLLEPRRSCYTVVPIGSSHTEGMEPHDAACGVRFPGTEQGLGCGRGGASGTQAAHYLRSLI